MKFFCALILFVSSFCSTQGCPLLSSCASREFKACVFDNTCRKLTTLNLANKGLYGTIPAKFNSYYGVDLEGDADANKPKVVLTKLELQQNQLSGLVRNLLTPTLTEVNLAGNPFTSANQELTNARPNIKKINLAGTSQTTLDWIGDKLPNLEYLNVANNQLTDGGLSAIAKFTKLTELDLSGNSQITDLTALVVLTKLKTLNVGNNAALKKQVDILTSGADPDTKRSQFVTIRISEVKEMAKLNGADLLSLKNNVNAQQQTFNTFGNTFEERVSELENKLSQLNGACFAQTVGQNQGQSNPGFNVGAPPQNDAGALKPGGGRRLADCIKTVAPDGVVVRDMASAAGLISVAAATVAAVLL